MRLRNKYIESVIVLIAMRVVIVLAERMPQFSPPEGTVLRLSCIRKRLSLSQHLDEIGLRSHSLSLSDMSRGTGKST